MIARCARPSGMACWSEALKIQARVVCALMLRETRTRFGRTRLGYLWALGEPVAHVAVLAAIAAAAPRHRIPGIDFPVFLIAGIVPWLLFSKTITRLIPAIAANRGLLHYPQVKPIDLLWARSLLELATYLCVFVLLMAGAAALGFDATPEDPLRVLAVFILITAGGTGIGCAVAAASLRFPSVERIVSMVLRPLYFVSGVFFTLEMLPETMLPLLDWNPLLHATDLLRDGYFSAFVSTRADGLYVGAAAIVSLFLGLVAFQVASREIGPA